jgi:hypothetical protein
MSFTAHIYPGATLFPSTSTFTATRPWPDMILEWAPADPPSAEAPAWVDITSRLQEWEWTYGRNDETGDFEAGQGYVLLDNGDRAFDPSYTGGAWYGNVKPRRKFRLRCQWNGATYPVFVAHSRGYPQLYPFETDLRVRIDLADGLALLKAVDLEAIGFNRPAERSDDRLNALLDEAGIPDAERDFGTGTFDVPDTDTAAELGSAQEHAQQIAVSEMSPVFVTRDGLFYAI